MTIEAIIGKEEVKFEGKREEIKRQKQELYGKDAGFREVLDRVHLGYYVGLIAVLPGVERNLHELNPIFDVRERWEYLQHSKRFLEFTGTQLEASDIGILTPEGKKAREMFASVCSLHREISQ